MRYPIKGETFSTNLGTFKILSIIAGGKEQPESHYKWNCGYICAFVIEDLGRGKEHRIGAESFINQYNQKVIKSW